MLWFFFVMKSLYTSLLITRRLFVSIYYPAFRSLGKALALQVSHPISEQSECMTNSH